MYGIVGEVRVTIPVTTTDKFRQLYLAPAREYERNPGLPDRLMHPGVLPSEATNGL